MPAESIWKEEVVGFLTQHWEAGASASEIADKLALEMSVQVTRSAVIGKIFRLNLPGRTLQSNNFRYHASVEVPQPEMFVPVEQRKTLLQLKPHHCRWPYGDPGTGDFYFCGGESVEGKPYCSAHCKIAFRQRDER